MPTLGVDGFLYDMTVDGKTANFKFTDPEDVNNTTEVSVSEKEMENTKASSREVQDYAYSLVSKELTDKRAARQAKAEADRVAAQNEVDAKTREAQTEVLQNSNDNTVAVDHVDADGNNVYNAHYESDDDKNRKQSDKKK